MIPAPAFVLDPQVRADLEAKLPGLGRIVTRLRQARPRKQTTTN
jgi:hypothetical protein